MTATTLSPQAAVAVRDVARETIPPITLSTVTSVELRKMFDTRSGFWLMIEHRHPVGASPPSRRSCSRRTTR